MFDRMGMKANGKREEGRIKIGERDGGERCSALLSHLFKLVIILIVWLFSINDSVLSRAG